jgi:hypothetical protein
MIPAIRFLIQCGMDPILLQLCLEFHFKLGETI